MTIAPIGPEPGYTTTEFYVTIVTQVLSLLVAFHVVSLTSGQTQTILGMASLVGAQIAYAVSRGLRKQGQ